MGQAHDNCPAILFRAIAPPRAIARLDYEGALWQLPGISPDTTPSGPAMAPENWDVPEGKFYPDFPVGKFEGEPFLVWVQPDIFRMEPQPKPFRFIRSDGEVIEPGKMFTDGGSIPRALWFVKDLSPWAYAPAFLIHDWLFDCHHAGTTQKKFEEVRDIMLEGVHTLMETGVCQANRLAFDLIYAGIDSFVARRVWNGKN